jgi:DNA-binding MarR family transcriptional regulator
MATSANVYNPADIRRTVADADPLNVLETEMALLQRALERLARRSDIHRVGLDATTVTRQVATMERRGLLSRQSDPNDGRVNLIELSAKGRRTMDAVQRARRERVRELFTGWPRRDQLEFGQLLGRFNDAVADIELRSPYEPGRGAATPTRRRRT